MLSFMWSKTEFLFVTGGWHHWRELISYLIIEEVFKITIEKFPNKFSRILLINDMYDREC